MYTYEQATLSIIIFTFIREGNIENAHKIENNALLQASPNVAAVTCMIEGVQTGVSYQVFCSCLVRMISYIVLSQYINQQGSSKAIILCELEY